MMLQWTEEMRTADAWLSGAVESGDFVAMENAARAWDAACVRMFAQYVAAGAWQDSAEA